MRPGEVELPPIGLDADKRKDEDIEEGESTCTPLG